MCVGHADELDGEAKNTIGSEKHTGDGHGRARMPRVKPDDDEQRHPFQQCLVQLRGVARDAARARIRKHHRPGQIGGSAPQIAVDEVAYPAQGNPRRHQGRDEIRHREKAPAAAAGKPPHGDHDAQQPAVKGHAALPDPQDQGRIIHESAEIVEQHVAEAPADDDAERDIEQKIVNCRSRPVAPGIPGANPAERPGDAEADKVHQAVPVNFHRSELQGDGIDVGKSDHGPGF